MSQQACCSMQAKVGSLLLITCYNRRIRVVTFQGIHLSRQIAVDTLHPMHCGMYAEAEADALRLVRFGRFIMVDMF